MAGKKKFKVRRIRDAPIAEDIKPTLNIDGNQLSGGSLDVGKTVQLKVTGKVITERIETYGPDKGMKKYTVEVHKVGLL